MKIYLIIIKRKSSLSQSWQRGFLFNSNFDNFGICNGHFTCKQQADIWQMASDIIIKIYEDINKLLKKEGF